MMDTRVKPAYDALCGTANRGSSKPYFASENCVGVLPVTCRNACEKAGTLA